MVIVKKKIGLYVDRSSRSWVIQDWNGDFWIISDLEEPWENKQPYTPGNDTELEPIPDHYKYMLRLPE